MKDLQDFIETSIQTYWKTTTLKIDCPEALTRQRSIIYDDRSNSDNRDTMIGLNYIQGTDDCGFCIEPKYQIRPRDPLELYWYTGDGEHLGTFFAMIRDHYFKFLHCRDFRDPVFRFDFEQPQNPTESTDAKSAVQKLQLLIQDLSDWGFSEFALKACAKDSGERTLYLCKEILIAFAKENSRHGFQITRLELMGDTLFYKEIANDQFRLPHRLTGLVLKGKLEDDTADVIERITQNLQTCAQCSTSSLGFIGQHRSFGYVRLDLHNLKPKVFIALCEIFLGDKFLKCLGEFDVRNVSCLSKLEVMKEFCKILQRVLNQRLQGDIHTTATFRPLFTVRLIGCSLGDTCLSVLLKPENVKGLELIDLSFNGASKKIRDWLSSTRYTDDPKYPKVAF